MLVRGLLETLSRPRLSRDALARRVIAQPDLVGTLLDAIDHADARVRFGAARVLELIAREFPATLYPHFDSFTRLLNHPNRILQWEGARILAHLVAVDSGRRFDRVSRRFFAPIRGPVMITAANLIGTVPVIAQARPEWTDRLARWVLQVERANYQTAECRNVAIGHAIQALAELLPLLKKPKPVLDFVRHQRRNRRPATRRKAAAFLARNQPV